VATLIPATLPPTATAGERTVAAVLAQHLPGAVVWYEAHLPRGTGRVLRPDFLLLGRRGLVVLEVKGWRARDVQEGGANRFQLEGRRVGQPEMQAYRYTLVLRDLLGPLAAEAGPVRYGLVLPFIARNQLQGASWAATLDPAHLITRDDLGAGLAARLRALPPATDALLSPETFAALRAALTPYAAPGSSAAQDLPTQSTLPDPDP
jgi:hypothetical protein